MAVAGRHLSKSSAPTLLLSQGYSKPAPCLGGFWLSPVWKTPPSPGQPVPVCSHSWSVEVFLILRRNLLCFSLCPLFSGPVTGHYWKKSGSVFEPSLQTLYTLSRSPSALSSPRDRLNWPRCLSLSHQKRCLGPFTIFAALHWALCSMSVSLLHWKARAGPQHFR